MLPEQLSWQLVRHNDETDNLIQSDYELLKGEPNPVFTDDGPLTALLVDFRLPSSTYATMVLREILKLDTSPANQARLNKLASDEATALATDAAALVEGTEKRKLNEDDDSVDGVKRPKVDDEENAVALVKSAEKRKLNNDAEDDDDDSGDGAKHPKVDNEDNTTSTTTESNL